MPSRTFLLFALLVGCGTTDYLTPAEEYYSCMAEKVAEYGDFDWVEEDCRYYANYWTYDLDID